MTRWQKRDHAEKMKALEQHEKVLELKKEFNADRAKNEKKVALCN